MRAPPRLVQLVSTKQTSLPAAYTTSYVSIHSSPETTHFISLIHNSKYLTQLSQIHAQLIRLNLFSNSYITTQLISSSFSKKATKYAFSLFRHVEKPNLPLFNSLIRGLCENSEFKRTVLQFTEMFRMGVRPDRMTMPFVCKSVSALGDIGDDKIRVSGTIHGLVLKSGIGFDSFVLVSLVDMYVKVGSLCFAMKVFDECDKRNNVLLWNVVINGCCKAGELGKAVELFEAMPDRNIGSWNSLIDGFLKKGEVKRANELFVRMPERNVVSWTTMVAGLSRNGENEEALSRFFEMVDVGVKPNDLSVVSALSACAKVGKLEEGVRIEKCFSKLSFGLNRGVGTAFVDMYAKCGDLDSASRVFGLMREKDLRTWSVMIRGSAVHGRFEQAVLYFEKMVSAGITPDGVVFLAVLTACSHSGKVDEGLRYFESMKSNYSIVPTMKHYAATVDLLAKAGQLNEALSFIRSMPVQPDFVIWGALFCACRAHKNIEMAKLASTKLLQLEPKHPGGYVFLSNVYAGEGRWEDVERVRVLMKDRSVKKDPGWSYT